MPLARKHFYIPVLYMGINKRFFFNSSKKHIDNQLQDYIRLKVSDQNDSDHKVFQTETSTKQFVARKFLSWVSSHHFMKLKDTT